MAHFLSAVTLAKLDERREDVSPSRAVNAGISAERDVHGFFRCVASAFALAETQTAAPNESGELKVALSSGSFVSNASSRAADARSTMTKESVMWCAEQNGKISVRDFAAQTLLEVAEKPRAYVYAMISVCAGVLWAGLSDGFIRIFDTFSHKLVDEVRSHCGAITALALAAMPLSSSDEGRACVVSASNDWTIAVWDPFGVNDDAASGVPTCICRLNAHSNAVRCLAVDVRSGSTLFASGGDDGVMNLWNLSALAAYRHRHNTETKMATVHANRGGQRAAFDGATTAALVSQTCDAGTWPIRSAHNGKSIAKLVFCGDSMAGDGNVGPRATNYHRNSRGGAAGAHFSDINNLTRIAKAEAAATTGVQYNRFVVSAGQDGAVRVWMKSTGQLLIDLEVRPCAITSLLHDAVHGRLWIGGVDSVITVYDENTLDHVTTLHDHSGAYVVDFQTVPGLSTTNAWALGSDGSITMMRVGPQACDSMHEVIEREQQSVIDGLRTTVLKNFETLQDLREEAQHRTNVDERCKRMIAIVLGRNVALQQRYLFHALRWRDGNRNRKKAALLVGWLSRSNSQKYLRRCYLKWRMFGIMLRDKKQRAALTDGVHQARDQQLRRRYVEMLYEAAQRKQKFQRLRHAAGLFNQSTDRSLMQLAYFRLLRYHAFRREQKAKDLVTAIMHKTQKDAILADYWEKLAELGRSAESKRKQNFVMKLLQRSGGIGLVEVYFNRWKDARPILRANRSERESVELLSRAAHREIQRSYFNKWMEFLDFSAEINALRAAQRAEQQKAEFEAAILETQHLTEHDNAERRARLEHHATAIATRLASMDDEIQRETQQLNELYRRKFMSSVDIDPESPLEEQAHKVLCLLKARGVNCGYDAQQIAAAREMCAALEKGDAVQARPNVFAPADPQAPMSRSATGGSGSAATTRAGTPLQNRFHRDKSGSGSQASPSRKEKSPVDAGMQHALCGLKQRFFDCMRREGYMHAPATAFVTASMPVAEEDGNDANADENNLDSGGRHDWAVPTTILENLRPKEVNNLMMLVKDVIVAYDVAFHAINTWTAPVGARPTSPRSPGSPGSASSKKATLEPPKFRPGLLREFMLNSHLLLRLVQAEYDRMIRHGVTAGDAYKDKEAEAKTRPRSASSGPRARGASTTTKVASDTGDTDAKAEKTGVQQTAAARLRARSVKEQNDKEEKLRKATEERQARLRGESVAVKEERKAAEKDGPLRMRPYIGLKVDPMTTSRGAVLRISSVAEGSPAEDAGVLAGDVLVRFANYAVTSLAAFNQIVHRHATIEKKLPLTLKRDGVQREAQLVVAGRFPESA